MYTGFGILLAVSALCPGFLLFNFFRDAYEEYKRTGKFYYETLVGNPALFYVSLVGFIGMLAGAVLCLSAA